jgi:hypothetical protein
MLLLSPKVKYLYIIAVLIGLMVVSYVGYYIRNYFDSSDEQSKMIQKYLLNESPLYGNNKPKLWIHHGDLQARDWRLHRGCIGRGGMNEPFVHLTVKTIVDQCAKDFNICLIDDTAFSKLLPQWDYKVEELAEPQKSRIRLLGLLHLVHTYGGMVVPNSFICLKSLYSFYESEKAFVFQNRNGKPDFYMFGAPKRSPSIERCIEIVEESLKRSISNFEYPALARLMVATEDIRSIDGTYIGVQNIHHEPILLDDLMKETPIEFDPELLGIYISEKELLSRMHYNWFAELTYDEIKTSTSILAQYMTRAIEAI